MRRIYALFVARNKEFLRDRSALAWNLAFPFLIIVGFGMIFSGRNGTLYKIGTLGDPARASRAAKTLLKARYTTFVSYNSEQEALDRLKHHKLDLVVDFEENRYWVNETSPKGYVAERLFGAAEPPGIVRAVVEGSEIRYVDWLLPGVLGMNVMFSCLFGVGYVIVRYRKNGVLKRLSATPLRPVEFLTAQVLSRFVLSITMTVLVYTGCKPIIGFKMAGHYVDLAVVAALGILCHIALGVLIAARTASEEFAGGLLNLVTWPMMFLSGVWFSLEGSPRYVRAAAQFLPLTHLIEGARAVMNDGKSLADISYHVFILALMTVILLGIGSIFFKWHEV